MRTAREFLAAVWRIPCDDGGSYSPSPACTHTHRALLPAVCTLESRLKFVQPLWQSWFQCANSWKLCTSVSIRQRVMQGANEQVIQNHDFGIQYIPGMGHKNPWGKTATHSTQNCSLAATMLFISLCDSSQLAPPFWLPLQQAVSPSAQGAGTDC